MAKRVLIWLCLGLSLAPLGQGAPQPALQAFVLPATELWLPADFLRDLGVEVTVLPSRVALQAAGVRQSLPLSQMRWDASGQVRLPLSALEERLGLQTLRLGGRLYLIPRPARLLAVIRIASGARLVLDRFTPVTVRSSGESLTLTLFNARPSVVSETLSWREGPIRRVHVTPRPPARIQLQLRLRAPARVRLARQEGTRFRLDLLLETVPRRETLGPGIRYLETQRPTPAGPTALHILRFDRFQERFRLETLLPAVWGAREPLTVLATRHDVLAAINANFFDPDTGTPIGLLVHRGRLEGDDHAGRGFVGVDAQGRVRFGRGRARAWAEGPGQALELDGLNRPPRPGELVWISAAYGRLLRFATPTALLRVAAGRIVARYEARTLLPQAAAGFLIATGGARTRIEGLKVGDPLRLRYELEGVDLPPVEAVGAGPLLLRDGAIVLDPQRERFSRDFAQKRAARAAVGLSAEGALILLVTTGPGLTLAELAEVLAAQGAQDAVALDGGGSASLVYRQGSGWRRWGGARPLAVGLAIVPR